MVGDDEDAHLPAADLGDASAGRTHGVNVQAAVGLVEDGVLRPQHGHLEDLGPFHLAAGEPVVHVASGELLIDLQLVHFPAEFLAELPHGDQLFALLALGSTDVGGRMAEEVGHLDAGDGDRPLEGHEQPRAGPLVRFEGQQVDPVELDGPAGDLVTGMTHHGKTERALARTVGTHQRMDLAAMNC